MRVVHVTLSLARGGRRTAILSLIEGLRESKVESYICCLDRLGCAPEEIDQPPERILVLGRRSLFDLTALRRFLAFCRERKIDVIHTHDAASQFLAALTHFALPHTPVLMTFHRSLGIESATLPDRLRNAFGCFQCEAILTASEERRSHFLAQNFVSLRKVLCLPLGTDLSRFHPDPASRAAIRRELGLNEDVVLIGTIGHFGLEKGVDIAIQAFQSLTAHPLPCPVAMVVFGDGERRPAIEKLAAAVNGSPGPIYLPGFRRDIDRCMAALDVLLHAPRQEAFGLVVIEAMSTGLPVVASRVGGLPELVRDRVTGFLAEPEDYASFAAALRRLLENPALLSSMGAEARRVALAEYGLATFAKRHLDLYESVLR